MPIYDLTKADVERGFRRAPAWNPNASLPYWWIQLAPGGERKGLRVVCVEAKDGENTRTPNRPAEIAHHEALGCVVGNGR